MNLKELKMANTKMAMNNRKIDQEKQNKTVA